MELKQNEKIKKALLFSFLGFLFLLSLYFIFFSGEGSTSKQEKGLNGKLPQANVEQLAENKFKAYELGSYQSREEQQAEQMLALSEYIAGKEKAIQEENPKEKMDRSVQQLEKNQELVQSFYTPDPYDYEKEELKREVEALREELREEQELKNEEEEQLKLLEKSYEMAAQYLPKQNGQSSPHDGKSVSTPSIELKRETDLPSVELIPEEECVVSSLQAPLSDSLFVAEYGRKERNLGFHSLDESSEGVARTTLKVVVAKTTSLQEGDYITLRLLERAKVEKMILPKHTELTAQAKIEGNRMQLLVHRVAIGGRILSLHLSAFDLDGQEGVFIPDSETRKAFKEMGANLGSSMGTSFTFSSSAKDQILSEVARGLMQGASKLLEKKLRTIKVTLKGGYRLLLVTVK